jgi:hypothetical protein
VKCLKRKPDAPSWHPAGQAFAGQRFGTADRRSMGEQ